MLSKISRRAALLAAAATALCLGAVSATAGTAAGEEPPTEPTGKIRATVPVEFTMSSLNILGSSHTAPGGKRARMASGPQRTLLAIRLLDRHDVEVVGFQELQMDQWQTFVDAAGDRYGTYPGGVSRRMVQNSIAWRLDRWSLVQGSTVKIPYFDGILWDMPVVLLQNRETGVQAYFANFHNPATTRRHRGNQKWRTDAMNRQATLANQLMAESGRSVFFTGDMNEREEYFCGLTSLARMKAANGGSNRNGVCTPPPPPMPVDWIFGAKGRGAFSNWVRDDSRLVNRITDHFVIRADVKIKSRQFDIPAPPLPEPTPEPTPEPIPEPTPEPVF